MPTKLKNLVITKVALVDEGSCSAAHIKLYKRKEGGSDVMGFEELMKSLSEDQQKIINDEVEKAKNAVPEGFVSPEALKAEQDAKAAAEADLAKANTELEKLRKADDTNSEEELLKNVDPAVRAIIEKVKAQEAAAVAVVKKMKDDADNAEALAKAKELPNIGAAEEELAKSFKQLRDMDEELFKSIFGTLKAANALIEKGVGLGEVGAGSGEGSDIDEVAMSKAKDAAWAKIEAKAGEIQKSAKCTKEQAIAKVIKEHRALYDEYLKEMK